MATPEIQTLMQNISSELVSEIVSGGTLAFMVGEPNAVVITNEKPETRKWKNYNAYNIVLYPVQGEPFEENLRMGGNIQRFYQVGISVYRKAQRKRRMLIFSDPNDTRTGVGAYEMLNAVMNILRYNTLSGLRERSNSDPFSVPTVDNSGDSLVEVIDFEYTCETLTGSGSIV